MYSLEVLQHLELDDGRIFEPGHDCFALSAFEVAELIANYPDYFKPRDEITAEFIANGREFIAKYKHEEEE